MNINYLSGQQDLINIQKKNCEDVKNLSGDVVNQNCDYDIILNTNNFFEVFFRGIAIIIIFLFVYNMLKCVKNFFF